MPTWTAPYEVIEGTFDEAIRPDGSPRAGYEHLIEAITASPPSESSIEVRRSLAERGVEFGPEDSRSPFEVDPVPRLFSAEEWSRIEAGLIQRVRALNLFLDDAYGDRRIVEEGIVPTRVLEQSIHFEPIMRRSPLPVVAYVAGPDLIRDAGGQIRVLEDNLRTPSGLAYTLAGREAVTGNPHLPVPPIRDLDAERLLAETIASADPTGRGEPTAALLSDGPSSFTWYEHRELAKRLVIPVVTPADLQGRADRIFARLDGRLVEIDVLYNRSSAESLRDRRGELTELGELLAGPLQAGGLACVNSFGTGIADDKATYCYVEKMIRFYLGESPILPSVPSFDLGELESFAAVIERIDELVIKPRWSFGGQGIVFGPDASPEELRATEAELRRAPADFVAQEPVNLSVHPTVAGERLEPRHIDLRPFVYTSGSRVSVLPGGLTRFADRVGELVVNSTQGGGSKDTWVLR